MAAGQYYLWGGRYGVVSGLQPRQQFTEQVEGRPAGWQVLKDVTDGPGALDYPVLVGSLTGVALTDEQGQLLLVLRGRVGGW